MEYLAQKYGVTHGTISKWKRKYGTISENVPCSTENVPCSSENVPCGKYFPEWFPEELKGQNVIDRGYEQIQGRKA